VKTIEALDKQPADLAAARGHLAILQAAEPSSMRALWAGARMLQASGDDVALGEVLAQVRSSTADPKMTTSERLCRLRVRVMDLMRAEDPKSLAALVATFRDEARELAAEQEPPASRIRLLGASLEQVQKHLTAVATRAPSAKKDLTAMGESLDAVAEAIYTRALETSGATDLRAHLSYAEHLVFRNQPAKGLEVATKALKLPVANAPAFEAVAAGLREIAIKAALAGGDDPSRFDVAAPFVKDLIASTNPRYAGMGHFFRGLIALEQSGITAAASGEPGVTVDPKIRDEAVSELGKGATALPDAPTAQALYGVALILTGEPGLGRQYLQAAHKIGGDGRLEPRYQVWAAWSVLQAGYPEEAEPILTKLQAGVDRGDLPKELGPTLHLLKGQSHQARRSPDQLRMARDEFQKAMSDGQPITPALQVRIAQIDLQLGETKQGMDRLNSLRADPKAGPSAERMIVLGLKEAGKAGDAIKVLAEARSKYPDSDELAELDSVLRAEASDAAGADAVLAEYLARHPDHVELAMSRARLLSGPLNRPDEARKLLSTLTEKAETSAPLVQVAMLDLARKDYDATAKTIAQIRARWKEAAAADLLDAQLALAKQDPKAAAAFLKVALDKDPNNKVALFWKALLDERTGSQAKASQALETIVKDKPVKEIDAGLSLTTAANWALADMALNNQDLDNAIRRFEGMLQTGGGADLDRAIRWKLVTARAGKGESAQAKAEVAKLLSDPKTTPEDRVQAADFYRRQGDEAASLAQLDQVLKSDPDHTGAVAYKALTLASKGRPEEASALLRAAISGPKPQPSNLYLMLAASENLREPRDQASARAIKALDEGLAKHPSAVELVQAKFQVMRIAGDPRAIDFVEGAVKADPSIAMRRVLAEAYREAGALEKSEAVVRGMLKETPKDTRLAASLVGLVSMQASVAAEKGVKDVAKALDQKTADLIRVYRAEFPNDMNFPQAECELASRKGDIASARRIAAEITAMDPASPTGPLLSARLSAEQGRVDDVVKDYDEALSRSPKRIDIRLALAQANLTRGKADEALRQAKFVLDSDRDQPTALLLKAQALVLLDGTSDQKALRRKEAADALREAITMSPKFLDAYHVLAEIRLLQGERSMALNALREGLKVNPNDDTGLSALVQHLCEPAGLGRPAPVADVQEAMGRAEEFDKKDERGVFALAVAVGFQRAGRIDLALPWARKVAKKIDRPIVHLTCGDILLAKAESTTAPGEAADLFREAVAEYDAVLKVQPESIEAINNKAWILHRYLKRNPEALELAESLAHRADLATLPAEFLDTLGSIQESMNQSKKAEETYSAGLSRAPNHPQLNYHLAHLLLDDPDRSAKVADCLDKALAGRARLSPEMLKDIEEMRKKKGL
jgi:tetratricopeptide (TPR) repeat protein